MSTIRPFGRIGILGKRLPSWMFEDCKKVIVDAIDSSMRGKNQTTKYASKISGTI